MASLTVVFWMYVILFAIIGAMRGWAKEIVVTFSVILGLFLITVLETYVGIVKNALLKAGGSTYFWFKTLIILVLVFFGYQTPNIKAIPESRFARERLQDTLLGFILGAFNGYLIVGTLWYILHQSGYPFPNIISYPQPGTPLGDAAQRIINVLPPQWLTIPWIYFAVGLSFVFLLVVFI